MRKTSEMSPEVRKGYTVLGVFGHVARAVVFALVGYGLIKAAIDYDPHKAIGLDGALRKLADASYGPALLGIVAAGPVRFAATRCPMPAAGRSDAGDLESRVPGLVLGPIVRYVDDRVATIWLQADAACEVEVLGVRERTWCVDGLHFALVAVEGLAAGRGSPVRGAPGRGARVAASRDRRFPPARSACWTRAGAVTSCSARAGLRGRMSRRTCCAQASTKRARASTRCAPTRCASRAPAAAAPARTCC